MGGVRSREMTRLWLDVKKGHNVSLKKQDSVRTWELMSVSIHADLTFKVLFFFLLGMGK